MSDGQKFSPEIKEIIQKKAGMCCCTCLKRHPTDIHHLVPKEEGGTNEEENGAPLCPNCHTTYGEGSRNRNWIRRCRDELYEIVATGKIADPEWIKNVKGPIEALGESIFKGQLISDRPRYKNKTEYHQWRSDHTRWYEDTVIQTIKYAGRCAGDYVRAIRATHGRFKQDKGKDYGYEQWLAVLQDDVAAFSNVIEMMKNRWADEDFRMVSRIYEIMPGLMAELKQDHSNHRITRELWLIGRNVGFTSSGNHFVYYYEDHEKLASMFTVLENYGLVACVNDGDIQKYVMQEALVDFLEMLI